MEWLEDRTTPSAFFVDDNLTVGASINTLNAGNFGFQVTDQDANKVFGTVSVLAALGISLWGLRRATGRDKWLCVALGLILGGTVGNLFDRVVFGGVRDFLYFYLIDWPVFNVADSCLVVGAGLLLVQAVFGKKKEPEAPAPEPPVTPPAA